MQRIYGKYVGSSIDSIVEHIAKHNLPISPEEYLEIGDSLTQGREGRFSGCHNGRIYTVVVRGTVCEPDLDGKTRFFGLLRSIRTGLQRSPDYLRSTGPAL